MGSQLPQQLEAQNKWKHGARRGEELYGQQRTPQCSNKQKNNKLQLLEHGPQIVSSLFLPKQMLESDTTQGKEEQEFGCNRDTNVNRTKMKLDTAIVSTAAPSLDGQICNQILTGLKEPKKRKINDSSQKFQGRTNIAQALQNLFLRLSESETTVDTHSLTRAFGWTSADSATQQDGELIINSLKLKLYEIIIQHNRI